MLSFRVIKQTSKNVVNTTFKSYGVSGQVFGLISSFFSNRWLWLVLDGKSSPEYSVNAGDPQDSIIGPTLFLLYVNDLPDDVICNIAIYADDPTPYFLIRQVGSENEWVCAWEKITF